MSHRRILSVGGALLVLGLTLANAPAQAQPLFPEGWSIAWFDVVGIFNVACTDFSRCNTPQCRAVEFYSEFLFGNGDCLFDNITSEFEPGKTRTKVVCRNTNFGFGLGFGSLFFPLIRQVEMDVTCSRIGGALWGFIGFPFAPASCGAEVTYKRIFPFGANFTRNESYSGVTIGGRRSCANLVLSAGADTPEELTDLLAAGGPKKQARRVPQ